MALKRISLPDGMLMADSDHQNGRQTSIYQWNLQLAQAYLA